MAQRETISLSRKSPIPFILILIGLLTSSCFLPTILISSTPEIQTIETIDQYFDRCPTAEEIHRIDSDFEIIFEFDPTDGIFVCEAATGSADLTSLQKHVYQTIYVTHLLRFSQPLPWTDQKLYDWLVDAIDGIRFVEGGYSRCCEPENIIVVALDSESTLLKTDKWIDETLDEGLMNVTLLYVHEARHNESYHHTCTTRNGDDNTLDEMGAWAVQYYLSLWIAQYSDPSFLVASSSAPDAYRRAALDDAEVTYLTRFCKETYIKPVPTLIP